MKTKINKHALKKIAHNFIAEIAVNTDNSMMECLIKEYSLIESDKEYIGMIIRKIGERLLRQYPHISQKDL